MPVTLTYKKQPQIKSLLGGTFTMMVKVGIFMYFVYSCLGVFLRENSVNVSSLRRDLT